MATAKKAAKKTVARKPVKKFVRKASPERSEPRKVNVSVQDAPIMEDAVVPAPILEEGPPPVPAEPVTPPSVDVTPMTTTPPGTVTPAQPSTAAVVPNVAYPSEPLPSVASTDASNHVTIVPDQGTSTTPSVSAAQPISSELSPTPTDSPSSEPPQNAPPVAAPVSSENSDGGDTKKLVLIFISVMVLTILIAGGGYYFYANFMMKKPVAPAPSQKSEKKAEVTPAPVEKKLSEYSVQVLNGSGTAGQAGKVAELLTGAGFKSIDTGNADSYEYKETEIQLRDKTPKAVYDAIEASLKDLYAVKRSSDLLSENSDYEVVIIVGSSKP